MNVTNDTHDTPLDDHQEKEVGTSGVVSLIMTGREISGGESTPSSGTSWTMERSIVDDNTKDDNGNNDDKQEEEAEGCPATEILESPGRTKKEPSATEKPAIEALLSIGDQVRPGNFVDQTIEPQEPTQTKEEQEQQQQQPPPRVSISIESRMIDTKKPLPGIENITPTSSSSATPDSVVPVEEVDTSQFQDVPDTLSGPTFAERSSSPQAQRNSIGPKGVATDSSSESESNSEADEAATASTALKEEDDSAPPSFSSRSLKDEEVTTQGPEVMDGDTSDDSTDNEESEEENEGKVRPSPKLEDQEENTFDSSSQSTQNDKQPDCRVTKTPQKKRLLQRGRGLPLNNMSGRFIPTSPLLERKPATASTNQRKRKLKQKRCFDCSACNQPPCGKCRVCQNKMPGPSPAIPRLCENLPDCSFFAVPVNLSAAMSPSNETGASPKKKTKISYEAKQDNQRNDLHDSTDDRVASPPPDLSPLDQPPAIPSFPDTGWCAWSFNKKSRVLLADFRRCRLRQNNPAHTKSADNCDTSATVTPEDEKFLLQMMERDDLTIISEGLADQLDPHLWDLTFIRGCVGSTYYHKIRRFERVQLPESSVVISPPNHQNECRANTELFTTHNELDVCLSMKVSDYFRYLDLRQQALETSTPDFASESNVMNYVDHKGQGKTVNVVNDVLYMIDYDMVKLLPDLYHNFQGNFKIPGCLPGGTHCMMHKVNEGGRPFMGPNLYITPPASFTHFHQDGHGTVDSGHQCLSGYNEVIMLRRMPEAHKRNALRILNGDDRLDNAPPRSYDALYGLPHGDGFGDRPLWPDVDAIERCEAMNYCPSVFVLKPGQHVHINKGRLHAFRKLSPNPLPKSDCHAKLRRATIDKYCLGNTEQLCISVAWDWMYKGVSAEGIKNEVMSTLDCAKLNRQNMKQSLAIPETSLLLMARSFSSSCDPDHVASRPNSDRTKLLGWPSSFSRKKPISPPDLDVLKGILPSLKCVVDQHQSAFEAAERMKNLSSRRQRVSISSRPDTSENPEIFALDPYGNGDFFCKLCSTELSNIYFHCDGCEKILNKDFNICVKCHSEGKYKIQVQMHPLNPKRHSTINHTGDFERDRESRCPCKNGPACRSCGYCAGCSCKCHRYFTLHQRFMSISDETDLLQKVQTIVGDKHSSIVKEGVMQCVPVKEKDEPERNIQSCNTDSESAEDDDIDRDRSRWESPLIKVAESSDQPSDSPIKADISSKAILESTPDKKTPAKDLETGEIKVTVIISSSTSDTETARVTEGSLVAAVGDYELFPSHGSNPRSKLHSRKRKKSKENGKAPQRRPTCAYPGCANQSLSKRKGVCRRHQNFKPESADEEDANSGANRKRNREENRPSNAKPHASPREGRRRKLANRYAEHINDESDSIRCPLSILDFSNAALKFTAPSKDLPLVSIVCNLNPIIGVSEIANMIKDVEDEHNRDFATVISVLPRGIVQKLGDNSVRHLYRNMHDVLSDISPEKVFKPNGDGHKMLISRREMDIMLFFSSCQDSNPEECHNLMPYRTLDESFKAAFERVKEQCKTWKRTNDKFESYMSLVKFCVNEILQLESGKQTQNEPLGDDAKNVP